MVAAGQLSLETLWEVLGWAGKLPESFDAKKEKGRIEQAVEDVAEATLRKFDQGE